MAQVQRRLANMTRILNMPVKVDRNGTRAQVTIPGLSYDDFDRTGYITLWKICRLLENRRTLLGLKEFVHLDKYGDVNVILSLQISIRKEFYDNGCIDFPLDLSCELYRTGNSSFSFVDRLRDHVSNEPYIETVVNSVHIDATTRRPKPMPEEFRKKQQFYEGGNVVVPELKPKKKPEMFFSSAIKVVHSDLDLLYHANQASYVKFSMNTAGAATSDGFYQNFKNDILLYKCKELTVLFKGENVVGDSLTVNTWEDEHNTHMLHFEIMNDEKPVFFMTASFYDLKTFD